MPEIAVKTQKAKSGFFVKTCPLFSLKLKSLWRVLKRALPEIIHFLALSTSSKPGEVIEERISNSIMNKV